MESQWEAQCQCYPVCGQSVCCRLDSAWWTGRGMTRGSHSPYRRPTRDRLWVRSFGSIGKGDSPCGGDINLSLWYHSERKGLIIKAIVIGVLIDKGFDNL